MSVPMPRVAGVALAVLIRAHAIEQGPLGLLLRDSGADLPDDAKDAVLHHLVRLCDAVVSRASDWPEGRALSPNSHCGLLLHTDLIVHGLQARRICSEGRSCPLPDASGCRLCQMRNVFQRAHEKNCLKKVILDKLTEKRSSATRSQKLSPAAKSARRRRGPLPGRAHLLKAAKPNAVPSSASQ